MAAKRQSNLVHSTSATRLNSRMHRNDREQHVRQQGRDAARAALDVARHPAGLPLQVKAQRQRMQMAEHLQRDAPDGALGDAHEHDVAQFREQRRRQPQQAVDHQQRKRQHQDGGLRVQGIDDALHHQRHADVGHLGGGQTGERNEHASLELQQVGKQRAQGGPACTRPNEKNRLSVCDACRLGGGTGRSPI